MWRCCHVGMKKDSPVTDMEEKKTAGVRGRVWGTLEKVNDGRPAILVDRNL